MLFGTDGLDLGGLIFFLISEIGALGLFLVVVLLGVCGASFALRFLSDVFVFFIITIILLFRLDCVKVFCWETGFGVIIDCG